MRIGDCIRIARTKANMTQMELAKASGIPYQTIGHWERNTSSPKYSALEQVAQALHISMAALVSGDDCEDSPIAPQMLSGLFDQIDTTLRATEATDTAMYQAWTKVAPTVQEIIMAGAVSVEPASPTFAKPMDSDTKRTWERINNTIEKVTSSLVDDKIAQRETPQIMLYALDIIIQQRKQMAREYGLQ